MLDDDVTPFALEAAVEASVPLVAHDSLGVDGIARFQGLEMVFILFEPSEIDR